MGKLMDGRTVGWSKRIGELANSVVMDTYNSALRIIFYKKILVFYATMDESVCPICSSLHGIEFKYNDTNNFLPIHPDCRCLWITKKEARRR